MHSQRSVTLCTWECFQNKAADTSAAQARNGKDIQGIPWDRLSVTRKEYRKTRLEQYKNYENVPNSGEESGKVSSVSCFSKVVYYQGCPFSHSSLVHWNQNCTDTEKGSSFYTFRRNSRSVRSTILHFQVCHVPPSSHLNMFLCLDHVKCNLVAFFSSCDSNLDIPCASIAVRS